MLEADQQVSKETMDGTDGEQRISASAESGQCERTDKRDSGVFSDNARCESSDDSSAPKGVAMGTASSQESCAAASDVKSPRPGDIPLITYDDTGGAPAKSPSLLNQSVGSLSLHGSASMQHNCNNTGHVPCLPVPRRHPSASSSRDSGRHQARQSSLLAPNAHTGNVEMPRESLRVGNSPLRREHGVYAKTTSPRRFPPFSPSIGASPQSIPHRHDILAPHYGCGFSAHAYAGQRHHQRYPSLPSPSLVVAPCLAGVAGMHGGYAPSPMKTHSYQLFYRM